MVPLPTATCGARAPPPSGLCRLGDGAGTGAFMSMSCRCIELRLPGILQEVPAPTRLAASPTSGTETRRASDRAGLASRSEVLLVFDHRELETLVAQALLNAGRRAPRRRPSCTRLPPTSPARASGCCHRSLHPAIAVDHLLDTGLLSRPTRCSFPGSSATRACWGEKLAFQGMQLARIFLDFLAVLAAAAKSLP